MGALYDQAQAERRRRARPEREDVAPWKGACPLCGWLLNERSATRHFELRHHVRFDPRPETMSRRAVAQAAALDEGHGGLTRPEQAGAAKER